MLKDQPAPIIESFVAVALLYAKEISGVISFLPEGTSILYSYVKAPVRLSIPGVSFVFVVSGLTIFVSSLIASSSTGFSSSGTGTGSGSGGAGGNGTGSGNGSTFTSFKSESERTADGISEEESSLTAGAEIGTDVGAISLANTGAIGEKSNKKTSENAGNLKRSFIFSFVQY